MAEKKQVKVVPSILSGDFGSLITEAKKVEDAGADALHIDIMDGHFVPNLTLGPKAVAAINRATDLFLDVHLMIYNAFDYVEKFIEAGADRITFHMESTENVEEVLDYIRKCNRQAGLAFCPETSSTFIPKYLNKCDLILLMTVNPGFGGQAFMPEVLEKISFVREVCSQLGIYEGGRVLSEEEKKQGVILPPFEIQVDGGINPETAALCVKAGANVLVSGTYIFNSPDMTEAVKKLRRSVL